MLKSQAGDRLSSYVFNYIRMVQLEQVISTQNQELQQLSNTVKATQATSAQLKSKLDRVKQFHEMLVDRVATQLHILNAAVNNNDLSQAEREWLQELKQFRGNKIPALLSKIDEVIFFFLKKDIRSHF